MSCSRFAVVTLVLAVSLAQTNAQHTTCREALIEDCGKETKGKECLACVDAHAATLKKDNCTESIVHAYCEAAPPAPTPGEECLRAEELYCGNDRHEKSLCDKCIKLHLTELKNKTCTEELEAKFCDGPAPPKPTPECYKVLEEYCEVDRKNHTECVSCVTNHANQTKAAHCTYTQVEEFCKAPAPKPPSPPGPVPPQTKCEKVMVDYCETVRRNETECHECLEKHHNETVKADCTVAEETQFCVPHKPPTPGPAPTANCTKEFDALCGQEHHNATMCLRCADEHKELLEAHGCTHTSVDELCHVHPPVPPHPPSPPGKTCVAGMEKLCEQDRHTESKCQACIHLHAAVLTKDGCTEAQEHEFCHATPPPPHPEPGRACAAGMEAECGTDRHNETKCHACITLHAAVLKKDNCTAAEEAEFCVPPKPPAPTEECEKVLAEFCAEDKHNATLCRDCLRKHENQTRAAHCTYTQEAAYCEAPKPPSPPGPVPPHACADTQYCCPDAKHCLTPIAGKSCAMNATVCTGATETCCPLTKMCVTVGEVCVPTTACKATEFCCPDAKACLTPVNPGKFCAAAADCTATEVCCPLIKQCVTASTKCDPVAAPAFMQA